MPTPAGIVLAEYIHSEEARLLYQHPSWLWLLVPMLLYWMSRVWLLANRGALEEDPIVFATKDRVTYMITALTLCILVVSSFGPVVCPVLANEMTLNRERLILLAISALFLLANFGTATRYPAVWVDEIQFADPAVNLALHGRFTSTAWFVQTSEEFGRATLRFTAHCWQDGFPCSAFRHSWKGRSISF